MDVETMEMMQFFPECSLNSVEMFIWTGVNYNSEDNLLAVEGCYWACPYSVQLFDFEHPMSEQAKFVDIRTCIDGDYDMYEELEFLRWDAGDLYLKAYLVENSESIELMRQ